MDTIRMELYMSELTDVDPLYKVFLGAEFLGCFLKSEIEREFKLNLFNIE